PCPQIWRPSSHPPLCCPGLRAPLPRAHSLSWFFVTSPTPPEIYPLSLHDALPILETLGLNLDLPPAKVARCVEEAGIGFLYAPLLHTAMKHVMAARREMGVRTVFNMLGPLTNPAGANAQVIGVYSPALTEPLARVL